MGAPSSRSVLVLGPHRSGTSATARVLNLLGVDLGGSMLPPKFDNRHGYWEHQRIFELHERLLSRAGSSWHDYRPMPPGWRDRPEVEAIRGELAAFLKDEFRDKPLWGVKDPRLSSLLPLWIEVLEEIGTEPNFVILVRNPIEVARSLERRDHFSPSKCMLLYMAHMLAALDHTRGMRRSFVSYDRLLEDWRPVVAEIGSALAIDWPHAPGGRADEIDAFLRPSERHHRHDAADLREEARVPGWCVALHEALEAASRGHGADLNAAFERAHQAFSSATALFVPELEALERERVELELRVAEAESEPEAPERQRVRLEQRAVRAESELLKVQRQLTTILSSRLYRSTRRLRHAWYSIARHLP